LKTVVLISANAEWRVVKEMYPHLETNPSPFGEYANLQLSTFNLQLVHGGWGKISAAASAQYVIDHFKPDLLINLGTCGGFAGCIKTGTIILVDRTLVYDILEQMGDSSEAIDHYASSLNLSWLPLNLPYPISRGLLVSADRDILVEDIPMLIEKYGAVAADWESGAIAWVANKNHTRLLILRGVTDLVGIDGGETYGNLGLFHERTKTVMHELFRQLPDWLNSIKI